MEVGGTHQGPLAIQKRDVIQWKFEFLICWLVRSGIAQLVPGLHTRWYREPEDCGLDLSTWEIPRSGIAFSLHLKTRDLLGSSHRSSVACHECSQGHWGLPVEGSLITDYRYRDSIFFSCASNLAERKERNRRSYFKSLDVGNIWENGEEVQCNWSKYGQETMKKFLWRSWLIDMVTKGKSYFLQC